MQIRQESGLVQVIRNQSDPNTGRRAQRVLVSWPQDFIPSLRNLSDVSDAERQQIRDFLDKRKQEMELQRMRLAIADLASELRRFRSQLPQLPELKPTQTGPIWRALDRLKRALGDAPVSQDPSHQE